MGVELGLDRPVAHTKASAEVLRQQLNSITIFLRAIPSQVTHGLHNNSLSLNVTRVSAARALGLHSRTHRDGENFGHEEGEYSFASTLIPFRSEALLVDKWKKLSAVSNKHSVLGIQG